MLIPLVEQGEGSGDYLVAWGGDSEVARGEEQVAEHEKQIRYAGLYPVRISEAEDAALRSVPERLHARFAEGCSPGSRVDGGRARLGGNGTQFVMVPGNDDEFDVDEVIQASGFVDAAENRIVKIGPHEMLSVGWSNTTPWDTPREARRRNWRRRSTHSRRRSRTSTRRSSTSTCRRSAPASTTPRSWTRT